MVLRTLLQLGIQYLKKTRRQLFFVSFFLITVRRPSHDHILAPNSSGFWGRREIKGFRSGSSSSIFRDISSLFPEKKSI